MYLTVYGYVKGAPTGEKGEARPGQVETSEGKQTSKTPKRKN